MNRVCFGAAFAFLFLAGYAQTQRAADTTVAAARAQVDPTLSTSDAASITTAARHVPILQEHPRMAQRLPGR